MTEIIKKKMLDLRVEAVEHYECGFTSLWLTAVDGDMPKPLAGQFVEIAIPDTQGVMLRRPISVNDYADGRLRLLVASVGRGSERLSRCVGGDIINVVMPLGNGFSLDAKRPLLVGGGVGVAPLLYLGRKLRKKGVKPTFLLGARNEKLLMELPDFKALGDVYVTTDDGTAGYHGLVTDHPVWAPGMFDLVQCCGPAPMMKAVARKSKSLGIDCEVSLENMMACGLGACLCCVEKTVKGNVCVCTEGPVFNINELTW